MKSKICPIKQSGDQIFATSRPWRNFDQDYTETQDLEFKRFLWWNIEEGRSAKHTVEFRIYRTNKVRYMDIEDFFKHVRYMIGGRMYGKFKFKKKQGSPKVSIYLEKLL